LPLKFETTGYNAWRDVLTPKQILAKHCKKFGFQTPKYYNNKLTIFDVNGYFVYETEQKQENSSSDDEDKTFSESESDFNQIKQTISAASNSNLYKDPKAADDISVKSLKEDAKEAKSKVNTLEEQLALDALNKWDKITGVILFIFRVLCTMPPIVRIADKIPFF
jgi:hypothetical protein